MLSHRSFLINLIVKFEFWLELTLVMEMINNPCVPSLVYAFPYMTCNSIWIPSFDITTSWGNWDLYSEWEKGCDCECVGGGETEIRRRVTRKTMLGSSATESSPLASSTTSILLFLMHKGYHEKLYGNSHIFHAKKPVWEDKIKKTSFLFLEGMVRESINLSLEETLT